MGSLGLVPNFFHQSLSFSYLQAKAESEEEDVEEAEASEENGAEGASGSDGQDD